MPLVVEQTPPVPTGADEVNWINSADPLAFMADRLHRVTIVSLLKYPRDQRIDFAMLQDTPQRPGGPIVTQEMSGGQFSERKHPDKIKR